MTSQLDPFSREYAQELDRQDPLARYREQFVIDDPTLCYLDGNSLGRLPKKTIEAVNNFLVNEWGKEVVTGWGHWVDDAQPAGDLIGSATLGAGPGQVLVCDTTSVNFYQLCMAVVKARPNRKTIITDAANFPTDRYILQGITQQFGMKLVVIDNETDGSFERITPEKLAPYLNDDVTLVTFEVIQYRSGARNPIKEITDLARKHGALVVWDASQSAGSIRMDFDANGIDLAVGCTYKYGNSGPGAPAWMYVNKRVQNELQVAIQGWFAQKNQFAMGPTFERADGIRGFQIATPPMLGVQCIKVAFSMLAEAGIDAIEKKAALGTSYMIDLFDQWLAPLGMTLKTPRDPRHRGGHVSIAHPDAAQICVGLREISHVIPDFRAPDAIRLAVSPLQTSFEEIWEGFSRIRDLVASKKYQEISNKDLRVT